ncbi:MAG: YihY/virulence factor BrkB family protein [Bacteroidales bacterium]|nr:YihY/virulence factor BrkB family protein [Bacteroidales bacterium]
MDLETRQTTYKYFNSAIHRLGKRCRQIPFPGSKGLSLYEVSKMYMQGLSKGSLNIRATSIAFHFMLALGPAFIFILGLIPYLPFPKFQAGIMDVMINIIPENSYRMLELLLQEVVSQPHHGVQIFGFLLTLFFVQKGLNGIIEAFNATYHTVGARSWIERRIVSVGLFIIFFILGILSSFLLFLSESGVRQLYAVGTIRVAATYKLLLFGKWIIVLALTYLAISFLFFLAPARKTKWRLFSPGSIFATLLSIITSIAFSYFVNHFAPFNQIYGSIGTLIAVMLWMNFNAMALLAGFELNASIKNARYKKLEPTVI